MIYRKIIKRALDLLITSIILIVIAPILILVVLILTIILKGNPFFVQSRPGYQRKIFRIIKFKTMLDIRGRDGMLLPDELRLFGFGKVLRKLSIDEFPQLFNVLFGDMSLIGPRPLLTEYLQLYNKEQNRRHEVRPGITGWAQVNGRNAISWKQKFEYDVWYVDHISLRLDLRILLMTISKVINMNGISQDGQATISKFEGN